MVWTTRIGKELRPLLSRIREWGLDGAELFLSFEEPANTRAVKKMLDDLELESTTCSVIPLAAAIWRDLASSCDEFALRGLQFVKNLWIGLTHLENSHDEIAPRNLAVGAER